MNAYRWVEIRGRNGRKYLKRVRIPRREQALRVIRALPKQGYTQADFERAVALYRTNPPS